ncbi:hypothetical protein SAMN03159343_4004 [Klenkia marina]|uniref:Uncharacterized protein n=2 Tax=Klenkia marina TaxID=1960309 RepID=A0A1G4Z289_9ACTN|nr:hypothetical protein SAMN03159343_4004 [Klenkia marina]
MARELLAVLRREPRIIAWDHLVDAFGWTSKDLRGAAKTANQSLRGTGMRVHIAPSGLALRADEQPVEEVIASLERLPARDDSMDNGTARVLYEVVTGSISQAQIRKSYGPRLGYLKNQGMVYVGQPGRDFIVPSDDVMFGFDV